MRIRVKVSVVLIGLSSFASAQPPAPATPATPSTPPAAPQAPSQPAATAPTKPNELIVNVPRDTSAPWTQQRLKATWSAQAAGVVEGLGLAPEKAAAVTKIYLDARAELKSGTDRFVAEIARRKAANDRAGMAKYQTDQASYTYNQREAFRKSLAHELDAKQLDDAMEALGTFLPLWDQVVDALLGFQLPPEKWTQGRTLAQRFNVTMGKLPQGDRNAAREVVQAARTMMLENLAKVLTADQLETVRQIVTAHPSGGPNPAPRGG